MRTVDPDVWAREVRKPPLNVSRPSKFGLKGLSPFETRLRKSFCDAMVEWSQNCSVEGFKYVMDRRNPKILRWCYLLAFVTTAVGGISLLSYNMSYMWTLPRVSARAHRGPWGAREDFPAVAVCSMNLLSRFAVDEYANYIYSLDRNNTYSLEAIKHNLLAYGAIHSRRLAPYDFNFEAYLAKVAHETNVTNILYKLSPSCGRLLRRCAWAARRVACARLFAARATATGYCCVFNSRYHSMDRHNPVYATRLAGDHSGLAVVVREHPGDVTQLRRPLDGFDVYIFDGWQYPAARAGLVTALPAPSRTLLHVRLRGRVQRAARGLWGRSDAWLGCHLNRNPLAAAADVERSWSWCVGACRRDAARALCRCAPHTLPAFLPGGGAPACALQHVPCLAKYSDKLTWLYPGAGGGEGGGAGAGLAEERENSVECAQCVPDCERARYKADVSLMPLDTTPHMFYNYFLKGVDLTNATVIRMFYTSEEREYFMLETSVHLYGLIALLGSQWVLLVGVTVVSVIELLYHCVFRWWYHYVRRARMDARVNH